MELSSMLRLLTVLLWVVNGRLCPYTPQQLLSTTPPFWQHYTSLATLMTRVHERLAQVLGNNASQHRTRSTSELPIGYKLHPSRTVRAAFTREGQQLTQPAEKSLYSVPVAHWRIGEHAATRADVLPFVLWRSYRP